MSYKETANDIIKAVGGKVNIEQVTHCATRLRFNLSDEQLADDAQVNRVEDVKGITKKGGQYQLIIGPQVSSLYDEVVAVVGSQVKQEEIREQEGQQKNGGPKALVNAVFDYLSGSLTPLIPILLAASLCKTVAAVFGPSLLNVISETSDIYVLFSFVGDAGFYFLPVFIGYSAARKKNVSVPIAMLIGAALLHPAFVGLATEGADFSVYGIPTLVQNYSSTVIPMILIVWIMSYVEKGFKKYTPDVLKVFLIPFGTLLVMLPLSLSVLAPLGGFVGTYIGEGIIAINSIAGPLGVAVIGGTFSFLVLTGMHPILFTYLFVTFPTIGYDNFLIPGILCASWSGMGVALACAYKFKSKKMKSLTLGYIFTWFLGGVGEPLLYGLSVPYKTPLIAGAISGFITGAVAGFLKLTAYVLNTSNGVYGLAAFVGGPTSNYAALVISIVVALVSGIVVMLFMKLDENSAEQ